MTTDSSFKRKGLTFIKLCYACFFHPGVPLEKSRLLELYYLNEYMRSLAYDIST